MFMQTFATEPVMEAPAKIAEECKAKITGFQELLPLITAICNAGLHERHWEQIATVVGFDVRPDEVTSLRRLLDYNIQDHIKVGSCIPCMLWCSQTLLSPSLVGLDGFVQAHRQME